MLKKIILIAAIILLSSSGALAIHLPFLQRQRPFDVGFSRLDIDYQSQRFGDNWEQSFLMGFTGLSILRSTTKDESPWPGSGQACLSCLNVEYPTAAQIVRHQLRRTIPMYIERLGPNSLSTKAPQADMGHFHPFEPSTMLRACPEPAEGAGFAQARPEQGRGDMLINDPLWLNYLWFRIY